MVIILEEIKLSLGLYGKKNTRETYRDHGGVGGAVPGAISGFGGAI